jgi:ATP-dependent Clp protease ATP-binding subunit ClpA
MASAIILTLIDVSMFVLMCLKGGTCLDKSPTIKLYIPDDLNEKYNYALSELPMGENTLIGYKDKLRDLEIGLSQYENQNVMILGEQGIGKTAIVEQYSYERALKGKPIIIVQLSIEALGALSENIMVSRMRSLLNDLKLIKQYSAKQNGTNYFDMCLFIDEVHKLDNYGESKSSSGAMNALKESTARGVFPIITATTDYEYRMHIKSDKAFDRRFSKIVMQEPDKETVVEILNRRLTYWNESGHNIPSFDNKILEEIYDHTDAFIKNQVNPAKSIAILTKAVARCLYRKDNSNSEFTLKHEDIAYAFHTEGYEIDINVTSQKVKEIVNERISGQPIAVYNISGVVNSSFYTKRNIKQPIMTLFLVGTTGTGKSETARALAKAFFGDENALLVVNGGDYSTENDALKAQHFIGDNVDVRKQTVILLDEIEKSHRNVLNGYMRMIDEGVVRDSGDVERSVNSTIIIATSNLGAEIFSQLAQIMELNTISNPDELSEKLVEEWYRKESSVRKALLQGDSGLDNGIKPEFLERFQLFIPYLPLPRIILAKIARKKLEKFREEQRELGYTIQLPTPRKESEWQELIPNSNYADIDPVSVMIAEDIIGQEASVTGARAINRFINSSVKVKVAEAIAERVDNNKSLDGAFRISTNGNSIFESSSRERPDVKVTFVGRRNII